MKRDIATDLVHVQPRRSSGRRRLDPEALARLRAAAGLADDQAFADAAGLSRAEVRGIVAGDVPGGLTRSAIARALGCAVGQLWPGEATP